MKTPRIVLVTGGGRGIGKAVCDLYAEQGWLVVAPDRTVLELGDERSIAAFFSSLKGPIHTVINNAGINPINLIEDSRDEDIVRTLEVDLMGPFRLLKAALPFIRKEPGIKHIVNVASIWAGVAKPGRAAYSMAKTGLVGLTRTAALEWAADGILVNAVAPGFTATELTLQNNPPDKLREIEVLIPLGRMAQPAEIARSIYFLGSEMNSYVTGQVLFVDGGYTCQ